MGTQKELMILHQQEKEEERIAALLGITYEELMILNYRIINNESNDGMICYYVFYFDDNAPRNILNKVKGLDSDDTVWFAPWELYKSEN
ncbi:MAG: hypothetical protein ABIJ97_09370 [Bacteroidota bacterium]